MGKKSNSLRMAQHQNAKQAMSVASQDNRLMQLAAPYIDERIQQVAQNLARQQLGAIGEVMSSIATLKEIMQRKGIATESEFVEARFDVEDAAWKLTKSTEGATKGDFVRTTYRARQEADKDFGPEARENVRRLGDDQIQPEIAEALVGMKTGEEKTIEFSVTSKVLNEETKTLEDKTDKYVCHIKVDRVSKYPAPAAPIVAKTEDAPAEAPAVPAEGSTNG